MSATIKLEIEGTAEEIMAAFKTFVGEPGPAEVFTVDLEYPGPRCAWCQTLLTQKQIEQGNKYCCRSCSFKGTNEARQTTRKANREKKALRQPIQETNCLECGKPLTAGQKKFCSKLHSNRYHMRERQLANVKVTHKPITVVAGQGIIKGSALLT